MKRVQYTKVIINGVDVSGYVFEANLPRRPGAVDSVDLSMQVASLDVTPEGVLVIEIDTRGPGGQDDE